MKAAFCTAAPYWLKRVYDGACRERIASRYELEPAVLNRLSIKFRPEAAGGVGALFSTWGMERFGEEEIRRRFPNLKYVFYGAGSVQGFAGPFLNCGVRVFSAADANAIPVAQYVFSQILLANKGMFRSLRGRHSAGVLSRSYSDRCAGNYRSKAGIIGVGKIGSLVARLLRENTDCELFCCDPLLPAERAEALGLTPCSLSELFSRCDCITNHLADKDELRGLLGYELFSRMKPYAVFINTGRGRQVDEKGLVRALRECRTRTALLDVTYPEPPLPFSPLRRLNNVFLTPHIAGSLGGELARMGDFMCEESLRLAAGEPPRFEVTPDMLDTLA